MSIARSESTSLTVSVPLSRCALLDVCSTRSTNNQNADDESAHWKMFLPCKQTDLDNMPLAISSEWSTSNNQFCITLIQLFYIETPFLHWTWLAYLISSFQLIAALVNGLCNKYYLKSTQFYATKCRGVLPKTHSMKLIQTNLHPARWIKEIYK